MVDVKGDAKDPQFNIQITFNARSNLRVEMMPKTLIYFHVKMWKFPAQ